MEGLNVRLRAPTRLVRTCERNRLEKQFLSDAYECLVAVIKHRCDDPHDTRMRRATGLFTQEVKR
jgi:hypothetical protein